MKNQYEDQQQIDHCDFKKYLQMLKQWIQYYQIYSDRNTGNQQFISFHCFYYDRIGDQDD